MPLLDHFHRPNSEDLPWESVNTLWVSAVVAELNRTLPHEQFRAFANRHLGSQVEADVAEFENLNAAHEGNGSIATAVQEYTQAALQTIPAIFPDDIEVQIADVMNRRRLVAVIEFVSPSNKKELAERKSFVAKCWAYLQKGIGLVVLDIVTERRANLHNELMASLGQPPSFPDPTPTYCVSYRPVRREDANVIDLWPTILKVGDVLPTIPLPLKGSDTLSLDLEATYETALEQSGA